VSPGIKTDKQLQDWIDVGIEYVMKSPPKKKMKEKDLIRPSTTAE
jgi:hypothetical protein